MPARKTMPEKLRAAAAYAHADADAMLADQKRTAGELRAAANFLLENAGPDLLAALKAVLDDYDTEFGVLTDGHFGKPNTEAYKAARRLVRQLERA